MRVVDPATLAERVLSRCVRDPETGCLIFQGALNKGYGQLSYYAGGGKQVPVIAHRVVYEATVGPIPDGLHIDHLCRNRACQEVAHMEPVTCRENVQRGADYNPSVIKNRAKTHCPKGHPYDEENTYRPPSGGRFCRTCGRAATHRWYVNRERGNA